MSEAVHCAVTDEEKTEQIAQLREVVRIQRDRLDAANQRVRELEEMLEMFRRGTHRPGITPPPAAPPATPGFPNITFQGRAGGF